jgi:hypothetical protein
MLSRKRSDARGLLTAFFFIFLCVLTTAMGSRPSRAAADTHGCSPSVCHFARLSSVECQLVLQMLDCTSRLRAARCCRSLRRDADDPFAWRGECSFFVSAASQEDLAAESSWQSLPRSLLRHAELLRCVWSERVGDAAAVGGSQRLHSAPVDPTTDVRLRQLLQRSDAALRSRLRRVELIVPVLLPSDDLLRQIVSLPKLQSLSLRRLYPHMLLLFLHPCALTELRLGCVTHLARGTSADTWRTVLRPLQRFKHLRSLLLTQPDLFNGRCRELFCHPNLSQLRELSLCHWDVIERGSAALFAGGPRSIPEVELQECFVAFTQLDSLQLRMVHGVGRVLESLLSAHSSPPLSRLLIELPSVCPSLLFLPSPLLLSSLSESAMLLHTTLVLSELTRGSGLDEDRSVTAQRRSDIAQALTDLQSAVVAMSRVRIVPLSSSIDVWTV